MSRSRVVYKVSGESLSTSSHTATDAVAIERFRFVAGELKGLADGGHEVLVVVGGGNLFRGSDKHVWPMRRSEADEIGMVATAINSLLLLAVLTDIGLSVRLLARGSVQGIGEPWSAAVADRSLSRGDLILVAGGVGLPFVSSDYAAVHHAVEIEADGVLAAKTGTDGVYDMDPNLHARAQKFAEISCSTIMRSGIEVMDFAAIELAKRFGVRIDLFSAQAPGAAVRAMEGQDFDGTIITPE